MFREVLQRSKQLEIFRFLPRISYFHHNGHSGSYPTGLPCQIGNFAVVAHIFLKFFRGSRATFWGLAGHFWPAGHRLGTTGVDDAETWVREVFRADVDDAEVHQVLRGRLDEDRFETLEEYLGWHEEEGEDPEERDEDQGACHSVYVASSQWMHDRVISEKVSWKQNMTSLQRWIISWHFIETVTWPSIPLNLWRHVSVWIDIPNYQWRLLLLTLPVVVWASKCHCKLLLSNLNSARMCICLANFKLIFCLN